LHRDEDVKACRAGSFQKTYDPQLFQLFMQCSRNGNDHGKICAVGRIEVKEEIIRVLKVVEAACPRVMVDATKARQEEQGSAVARRCIVNLLAAFLGIERNGLEPLRQAFAQVLLKERLPIDSIGVTPQNQCAVLEKRQDVVRHAVVVGEKVALG